jgi:hypothetical protein
VRILPLTAAASVAIAALAGCSAGPPPPEVAETPRHISASTTDTPEPIVVGSSDSVSVRPGSAGAIYRYRFRQSDPSSDKFQFQDRDLSFYTRPTPGAVHFQVENRKEQPVQIDWDRSTFTGPFGRTGKIAHATTMWRDRFSAQSPTMIPGLSRYSDYVFPVDYLVDPGNNEEQLHRVLFPEDQAAPQYDGRTFGMNLVFIIEGQPRNYPFTFRVESVLPR